MTTLEKIRGIVEAVPLDASETDDLPRVQAAAFREIRKVLREERRDDSDDRAERLRKRSR